MKPAMPSARLLLALSAAFVLSGCAATAGMPGPHRGPMTDMQSMCGMHQGQAAGGASMPGHGMMGGAMKDMPMSGERMPGPMQAKPEHCR